MGLKDNKTKITFYQGMKTIGGTYIEVKYNESSIYFDFGLVFNPNLMKCHFNLHEMIEKDYIPELSGVYDRKITNEDSDLYKNKAVFISHIHLDHTQMINYIDDFIDVYMSKDTKKMLESLNIDGNFIRRNKNLSENTRNLTGVDYDEVINIGEIKVKFKRVDHDGYGACGLIINTPEKKIIYTGDIRFHGYLKEFSEEFLEESKGADILIMEGVNVSFDNDSEYLAKYKEIDSNISQFTFDSEFDLLNKFEEICSKNIEQNIFFNYYEANLERILKIEDILKKLGKKLVLDSYNAQIIKNVIGKDVYYYIYEDNNYNLLDSYKLELDEVLNDNNYFVQIPFNKLEIMEKVDKNSLYFHIDANPLGYYDKDYLPFVKKIKESFKISYILKCSGHANKKDLFKIIDVIKPKILVPIHSFKPEMLYNKYGSRILPERKETI